jgi:hypothetical protein
VENCQGSSRVYTNKSQYTHHLSLLQMMSPPTPKRKKRFWVLAFGVCEKKNTHTQYTHTSCGKKECLLLQISIFLKDSKQLCEFAIAQVSFMKVTSPALQIWSKDKRSHCRYWPVLDTTYFPLLLPSSHCKGIVGFCKLVSVVFWFVVAGFDSRECGKCVWISWSISCSLSETHLCSVHSETVWADEHSNWVSRVYGIYAACMFTAAL